MPQPSGQHQIFVVGVVGVFLMLATLGVGSLFVRFGLPASRLPGDAVEFCVRVIVGIVTGCALAIAAYSTILFVAGYVLALWRGRAYADKSLEGLMDWRLLRGAVHAGCRLARRP